MIFDKLDSRYNKFLTILLIIVIIGIIGLLAYMGYDLFKKIHTNNEAEKFIEQYEDSVTNNEEDDYSDAKNPLDEIESASKSDGTKQLTYKGFEVAGTIEIPTTKVKYPVLTKVSKKALENAVAIQYGPGLNQSGNTVIVGHNYRNGLFFSNNKKLAIGDSIYITDNSGVKMKYTIYNKYETTPEDTDYMIRDTAGKTEISLSTCTDNSSARLIIWAKAEQD